MAVNHSVVTFSCSDKPGIVYALTGAIVSVCGNITELQQYSSPDTGRFFTRIQVEHDSGHEALAAALEVIAQQLNGTLVIDEVGRPTRTLILVSQASHTLAALLGRQYAGTLPIDVKLVLGNHEKLAPLAGFYGVPFEHRVIFPDTKAAAEQRIRDVVVEQGIELVVLARYMQILSPNLCDFLAGKAINIHHSFLPGFKGANPYKQAHARGVKLIGATAHFVTGDLDEGPIIAQSVLPVDHSKGSEALRELGRDIESTTLLHAVRLFAEHRILLDGVRTVIFE
ncbi:MAG: formyltetrahydrofolate deformylase [Propionibacteriaceae bacterium]|jgi:formyltetrahydrofolate deformylase|nr:formyltetrahydrofolate deformylase [Propionibacteriaceae bacterium]